jgi:arylsulfatase A-like enzyme
MNNDYTAYPWPYADDLHATNWTVERALDFLRDRDPSCPFFLTVSFLAAHPPLQPPAPYFERYVRTGVPEPYIGDWETPPPDGGLGVNVGGHIACLKGETLLSARAGYYGLINHLDDQIHRLLYPSVSGIDFEDTIVMLVSDHGEMLGDHYRWHKTVAYEGSARIPFMLRAPARYGIDPGTVLDDLVCLEDVMPTLLDMAGIDIPGTVEGASLLPAMRNGGGAVRDRLHIEHAPSQHGLTDGRAKYIWHANTGREQFFDLETDPHELHDRIGDADAQDRIAAWRAALVETLRDRPEGFSDGQKLIPGRPYRPVLPHALPQGSD